MRLPAALAVGLLSACALADHLIDIPTANKFPTGAVTLQAAWPPSQDHGFLGLAGFGIGPSFAADIRQEAIAPDRSATCLDLDYNFTEPVYDLVPGLDFGILDAANVSSEGRRAYLATTLNEGGGIFVTDVVAQVTLGYQLGRKSSPFAGVFLPLGNSLALIAEHDGFRLSGGLELRLSPDFRLRLVQRAGVPMASLTLVLRK